MNLALSTNNIRRNKESAIETHSDLILKNICHPSATIAIWHRQATHQFELSRWPFSQRLEYRFQRRSLDTLYLDLIEAWVGTCFTMTDETRFLFEDICKQAQIFSDISIQAKLQDSFLMRLEYVSHDHCTLFHVDRLPLRLITTYQGRGTEWLHHEDVNRQHLNQKKNHKCIRAGGEIQIVNRMDVAILKGELFPGNSGSGLVHRSPKVCGPLDHRILFRIDTEL